MTTAEFNKIVEATGKSFECNQSASGYYMLVCGDEVINGEWKLL